MVGKVLVVDDEDTLRLTVKTRLTAGGFETDAAVDGEEAIEKLKQIPFDVVLLDINMPRMDGITALGIMTEEYPNTDVIMLTGFADFATAIECLKKGAKDYLVKPIDTTELITRMRSLLRARHSEAALNSLKRNHATFLFDQVVDSALKIQDAVSAMADESFGKVSKDQSTVLSALQELSGAIVSTSVKTLEAQFLTSGGNDVDRENISLEKILEGVSEYCKVVGKSKGVDFTSDVKGKQPKILGSEPRLREAVRSVAVAALGLAAKGAKASLSVHEGKDKNSVMINISISKIGDKGQKAIDQVRKPIESIGGQLQKLDHDALLLYTAQRTLMTYGGNLDVESSKGGTVFGCRVAQKSKS